MFIIRVGWVEFTKPNNVLNNKINLAFQSNETSFFLKVISQISIDTDPTDIKNAVILLWLRQIKKMLNLHIQQLSINEAALIVSLSLLIYSIHTALAIIKTI